MTSARRLRVNPILCDGVGFCAEIVPELISIDDWGFPVVDTQPIEDETWLRHARRAVATCPRLALVLEGIDSDRREGGAETAKQTMRSDQPGTG